MTPNHVKILYALNALFFCALVGVSLYAFPKLHQLPQADRYTNGAPINASTTAAIAGVTVGNNANTPAAVKMGSITQIGGGTLTIKDKISGKLYTVSTNADTKVLLVGSQKDPAVYQKEMDAYYAQIKLLVQDPIKNKGALASLSMPTPVEFKPGTLANLAVSDSVEVTAAAPITGANFTAVKIFKAPSAAQ